MKRRLTSFVVSLCAMASAAALAQPGSEPPQPQPQPHRASPLSEVERVLTELERTEQATRKKFEDLRKLGDAMQARTLLRARAYVRLARAGLLPVGDGFAAFVDHAAKLERLRNALSKDLLEQKAIVARRAELAARLDEIGARVRPLRVEREALAQAESTLLSVEDRERAFERAFDTSRAPDHSAVYGAVGPSDPTELARGFAGMKGRLPFPITGRSEIKSARRNASEGPGLEMRAPFGTPVRAIYPGRVAFADTYADYGKTVILDHGNHYYTLSANLGTIDVEVGDEIDANRRIGTVGDMGRGSLVYLEIRVGTATVDPAEWFGL